VIRWIRKKLGTAARNALTDGPWFVLDVRFLVDKAGNSTSPIKEAIDRGVEAFREGRQVVVACDFGISRSNAIAAGILSIVENISFEEAIREVSATINENEIKLDMVESVRRAIGAGGARTDRRNVLVTGASGFLGTALVPHLANSYRILAPSRRECDLEKGAVALADYCAREGVGEIIHLAYPRAYTNASATGSSLLMLRAVLDTCRLLNIRLIFVSSWVLFSGYAAIALDADETTALRPKGVYAETKYLEEALVDLCRQRGDVACSICRLAPVYGPGGHRPYFIRAFYDLLLNEELVRTHRFRNGRPALDLLHISDAVDALRLVLETKVSDVFHFGTGDLHTTFDCAALIAKVVGRRLKHSEIDIEEDISNIMFVSRKARTTLGWYPKISIEEGLPSLLSTFHGERG